MADYAHDSAQVNGRERTKFWTGQRVSWIWKSEPETISEFEFGFANPNLAICLVRIYISTMLAPPERRRKNRGLKKSTVSERRAADRERKRKQLEREKLGLHRCTLWISSSAYEGLLRMFTVTQQLSDAQSTDHHRFEAALAALIETQGREWTR